MLVTLSTAQFMAMLDNTAVNVALPSIRRALLTPGRPDEPPVPAPVPYGPPPLSTSVRCGQAVRVAAACCKPRISTARSRISALRTLPVTVIGNSVTTCT